MLSDSILQTPHVGCVLDVAIDAGGNRLSTVSEDGTVCLYEFDSTATAPRHVGTGLSGDDDHPKLTTDRWKHITMLKGDGSSVTCVSWAPLAYYNSAIVACTGSGQVLLWNDFSCTQEYEVTYNHKLLSPGCCVSWAPQEYGKLFAVGCMDGTVCVFTGQENSWDVQSFCTGHRSCSSLCFAPFFPPGALLMTPLEAEVDATHGALPPPPVPIAPPRMLTCGSGSPAKVWVHSFENPREEGALPESVWTASELKAPQDLSWQQVAWAPNVGLPFTYIAAGSDDGRVIVWSQDGPYVPGAEWRATALPQLSDAVTKLSWSPAGTFLLVSCADGTATMLKETEIGEWETVSELGDPNS